MWTWICIGLTWVAIGYSTFMNARWQRRLQGREKEVLDERGEMWVLRAEKQILRRTVTDLLKQNDDHRKQHKATTEWLGDEKVRDFL